MIKTTLAGWLAENQEEEEKLYRMGIIDPEIECQITISGIGDRKIFLLAQTIAQDGPNTRDFNWWDLQAPTTEVKIHRSTAEKIADQLGTELIHSDRGWTIDV